MSGAESRRAWWTLAGACAGLFLLMLDSTVVALALPELQKDLGVSATGLQWVLNGYLLVVAILVVSAGRLGDMFGRKRVFLAGMAVFAAGSAISGGADGEVTIVAGRAVQGAGAAAMLPLSLALVCDAFPAAQQPRALGIWAAVSAIALAIGPLAGGLLVSADWRIIFWINLPVAAAGFAVTALAARESTDPAAGHRIDLAGLITLTVGMGAFVLAIVQSRAWGWESPLTLGMLFGGCAVLAAFWLVEHRVSGPIVDFSLFRNGPYFGASAAAFALVGSYWTVMFYQPQYLQNVQGHTPVQSGLLILPVTLPMVFISPFSGPLIARFGARWLMTAGMLCGVAGTLVLTRIGYDTGYPVLLAGYLLFGIALGLVYSPMSTAAMEAMPPEKSGIASGVLAMVRVLAGAVGLAVTGAVFHLFEADRLDALRSSSAFSGDLAGRAFSYALASSTWISVGILAVGAVLTWTFVRDTEPAAAEAGERRPEHHQHHRKFHLA